MEARILTAAAVAVAIAGCSHATNFDLHVSNETQTTQSVTVSFERVSSGDVAFEKTLPSIPADTTSPPVKVRIEPGEYKIKATAGTLMAERTDGLGTSIVSVSVGIRANEIIIGVGRA